MFAFEGLENWLSLFFARFRRVFEQKVIFKKFFSRLRFSFFEAVVWLRLLAMTIPNHQNQKSHFLLFLGKKFGWKNASLENLKKAIFWLLRHNRYRYRILECTIRNNVENTTKSKKCEHFWFTLCQFLVKFLSQFHQFFRF